MPPSQHYDLCNTLQYLPAECSDDIALEAMRPLIYVDLHLYAAKVALNTVVGNLSLIATSSCVTRAGHQAAVIAQAHRTYLCCHNMYPVDLCIGEPRIHM